MRAIREAHADDHSSQSWKWTLSDRKPDPVATASAMQDIRDHALS